MTGAPEQRDDAALLRAHIAGDRDAFGDLVRRHRDRLWAVALRTLGDREEAADAVQDALLSAYRGASRFRGDSAVTTWLHRIVINACLDRARRRQARPSVPLPEVETALGSRGVAPSPDSDTAMVVRAALDQLPEEQRIALILLDMHGYSVAEISGMLGVPEGTVKSRCARGRARLALALGHLRGDGGKVTGGKEGPDANPAGADGRGVTGGTLAGGNLAGGGDVRSPGTSRATQPRGGQGGAT